MVDEENKHGNQCPVIYSYVHTDVAFVWALGSISNLERQAKKLSVRLSANVQLKKGAKMLYAYS